MDASLVHKSHGGGLILLNLGNNWEKTYHYEMVEAKKPSRLDNASILYIYKVFKHRLMQWVTIWMHP